MDSTKFQEWAVVELFGHQRAAGLVMQAEFPAGFVRIDIPCQSDGTIGHSRFFSPQSIFSLSPVAKETAIVVALSLETIPIKAWEVPAVQKIGIVSPTGIHLSEAQFAALSKVEPFDFDEADREDYEPFDDETESNRGDIQQCL